MSLVDVVPNKSVGGPSDILSDPAIKTRMDVIKDGFLADLAMDYIPDSKKETLDGELYQDYVDIDERGNVQGFYNNAVHYAKDLTGFHKVTPEQKAQLFNDYKVLTLDLQTGEVVKRPNTFKDRATSFIRDFDKQHSREKLLPAEIEGKKFYSSVRSMQKLDHEIVMAKRLKEKTVIVYDDESVPVSLTLAKAASLSLLIGTRIRNLGHYKNLCINKCKKAIEDENVVFFQEFFYDFSSYKHSSREVLRETPQYTQGSS